MKYMAWRSKKLLLFTLFCFVLLFGLALYQPHRLRAACGAIVVTNTNDAGIGSLRQAIQTANSAPGQSTICFNINGTGVHTIVPTSPLPAITSPAIIDGTSQPGYSGSPLIELNGASAGNQPGIWITAGNSTIRGLVINRFGANGIFITNTGGNVIAGNYIGTDSTGTTALPNGTDGVGILNSSNNLVGGTTTADRNVISGNTGNGVGITGSSAAGNTISGNFIGTSAFGNAAVANSDGVLINQSPNNTVGGATGTTPNGACTGACNLISGNRVNGIGLWMSTATGNVVQGNFVGVVVSGTGALPNGDIGVEVNETSGNTVGGTNANARNILSGNQGAGLFITGANGHDNTVEGNFIGTNSAGTAAVANQKMGLGIGYSTGIQPAHNNTIGGTTGVTPGGACTGACNVIAGNKANGVLISGAGGSNTFYSNYIGAGADGVTSIGNGIDGIGIADSPNNAIGGTNTNQRNVIAANGDNGLIIVGAGATGNRFVGNYDGLNATGGGMGNTGTGITIVTGTDNAVLSNSIYANGKLGIDLNQDNVTLNHNGAGSGANHSQNYPMVYAARTLGTRTTTISGSLNSAPNTTFTLEFFSSDGCNAAAPLNFGQGQHFLGSTAVTTDQYGNSAFTFASPTTVSGGKYITATSTKQTNGIPAETSEFSQCLLVNSAKPAVANGASWFLKYDLTNGPADVSFGYGFPATLLMCAWDPNQKGVKLPVVVSGTSWFERASYTAGTADNQFSYGFSGGTPICGDWTGSGIDTPGMVSSDSTWFLRNSNSPGAADTTFQWGPSGGVPAPGNWDGSGRSLPGMYLPSSDQFISHNANASGPADNTYSLSGPGLIKQAPGGSIVVGDWTGEGRDKIGWVSTNNLWNLGGTQGGNLSGSFQFGFSGVKPVLW